MSTPFEQDEQLTNSGSTWNPWEGPKAPGFFAGMNFDDQTAYTGPLYRTVEAMGAGAASLEMAAGKAVSAFHGDQSNLPAWKQTPDTGEKIQADARQRIAAMTPDPQTTGTAVNLLHGIVKGAYMATAGSVVGGAPGAITAIAAGSGASRYDELIQQGVDPTTALKLSLTTAGANAAGMVIPMGVGNSLLSKLVTGAVTNVGFGMVSRGIDSKILEDNGYHDMAEQTKVMDGTQILIDGILGAGFGGLAHLHADEKTALKQARNIPDALDPALAANLATADRAMSPGVPTTPEAANAHQAMLEKALQDVTTGNKVDVSEQASGEFLKRPEPDTKLARQALAEHFKMNDIMDEEAQLRDLENVLAVKRGESPQPSLRSPEENTAQSTDAVSQALTERPDMTIPTEQGEVKATDLLQQVDDHLQQGQKELPAAIQAAVTCFGRKGA